MNTELSTCINKSERIQSLDMLKAASAFLVVCIHAPFGGWFGECVTSLARIAVPIFFIISGFFFEKRKSFYQIRKLIFLMLMANSVYFIWKSALEYSRGLLHDYWSNLFTLRNLGLFILTNANKIQSHLWYLGAILYVIIIASILAKVFPQNWKKILRIITPILLLGDLTLGKYSLFLLHCDIPYIATRNWLFVGIPYFTIGQWIKEKIQQGHVGRLFYKKRVLLFLIVLTCVTTLLEKWILVENKMNATRDHYLSTSFLAVFVFLFFLLHINGKNKMLVRIGNKDSTWVYILHPIVICVLDIGMKQISSIYAYKILRPIVVFIVSTIIVDIIVFSKERLDRRG